MWTSEQYQEYVRTGKKPMDVISRPSGAFNIQINPVSKPRMTQSDKWRKRPVTDRYWEFKNELLRLCESQGLVDLPKHIKKLRFVIAMPDSWSWRKKNNMCGMDHEAKPDLDNLLKSLQDCLCKSDQHICKISELSKIWGYVGSIEIII